jgi:hypothetical protein
MLFYPSFSETGCEILPEEEWDGLIVEEAISAAVRFDLFRCYLCEDASGISLLVLTEHQYDTFESTGDPKIDTIEGFKFTLSGEDWKLEWKIRDFIIRNEESMEVSIWFWTKYMEPIDIDGNGFIDPYLVYGTWAPNNFSDGRIKILVFKDGKKRGIRHQNSPMDFGRNTTIDEAYYDLPTSIRLRIETLMTKIHKNNHGIFPAGWKAAMRRGVTYIEE